MVITTQEVARIISPNTIYSAWLVSEMPHSVFSLKKNSCLAGISGRIFCITGCKMR